MVPDLLESLYQHTFGDSCRTHGDVKRCYNLHYYSDSRFQRYQAFPIVPPCWPCHVSSSDYCECVLLSLLLNPPAGTQKDFNNFEFSKKFLKINLYFLNVRSISGAQAAAISYVGEFHSVKTRSRHVTLATCFMPGSTLYQGLVGIFVMPMTWRWPIFGLLFSPWRLYLLSCSCICLVAFVGIGFLPESPKFLLAIGKQDEALAVLRRVYRINTGKREEVCPVSPVYIKEYLL